MATPDVVVLRRDVHGMPVADYVDAIRERLPDREVVHARTPQEERERFVEAPVVTGVRPPDGLLEEATNLELFACVYAGVDHLPVAELDRRGVAVTNASGVHGPNAAESVLGHLLTFARGHHTAWRRQERNEYRHYQAGELKGSTVTVVGVGAIGEAILDRLEPFEVDTIGVRYTPEKGGPADEVVGLGDDAFHDALARTDYLVLACPLTDETRGLVDAEAFETLSPESVVVNVARGPVVDTDALVDQIQRNGLRGAALDVTDPEPLPSDHELWTFENVLLTPHVAGQTPAYYERVADVLAENVRRLAEDGEDAELVNRVRPG